MKITLSKQQWEFIGKKTGWIKTAGSQDIDKQLRDRHPWIYSLISRMPNYQSALDTVDNIKNNKVAPEQAGINESAIYQAKEIIKQIINRSKSKKSSNQIIIKEALILDARIIAAIILLVLGIFMANAVQNAASGLAETQTNRLNEVLDK